MQHEPRDLRMNTDRTARSRRQDAIRRARRVVSSAASASASARDEAFAELPAEAPPEKLGDQLIDQIAEQLKQLDAQRAHLKSLLSRVQD